MVSYSAKLDSRTKQHSQFGVSVSNGSRNMARTKVAEKKEKKRRKKKKKIQTTLQSRGVQWEPRNLGGEN